MNSPRKLIFFSSYKYARIYFDYILAITSRHYCHLGLTLLVQEEHPNSLMVAEFIKLFALLELINLIGLIWLKIDLYGVKKSIIFNI